MTWLQRYHIRHYLANSIWILPSLGMLVALVAVPIFHRLEEGIGWESAADADAVRAVLGTLASAMFTFVVFVCSALLVAVQLASSQLTPRIIAAADALRQSVAVGQERTVEQDPAFAFRIMVDIASKGLSPAINDPTTAVLALDQIHHLLRNVGSRNLDDERVRDATGRVRLVYRTPTWEDFVQLAVTEIRHFGSESIQIARRLRAMLEDLIQTLPETRAPLLRQELSLLHRSAERFFVEPEDRALAEVSDSQGVGSKCGQTPR